MKKETIDKIREKVKKDILAYEKENNIEYLKRMKKEVRIANSENKKKWELRKHNIATIEEYQRNLTLADARAGASGSIESMGCYYFSVGKEEKGIEMLESNAPCYANGSSIGIINRLGDRYASGKTNPEYDRYKSYLDSSIERFKYAIYNTKDYSGLKVPLIIMAIALLFAIVFLVPAVLPAIIEYVVEYGTILLLFLIPGFVCKKLFRMGNFVTILIFIAFAISMKFGLMAQSLPIMMEEVNKYLDIIKTVLVAAGFGVAGISGLIALKKLADISSGKEYERNLKSRYYSVLSNLETCKDYINIRLAMCSEIKEMQAVKDNHDYDSVREDYFNYYKMLDKEFEKKYSNYPEELTKEL